MLPSCLPGVISVPALRALIFSAGFSSFAASTVAPVSFALGTLDAALALRLPLAVVVGVFIPPVLSTPSHGVIVLCELCLSDAELPAHALFWHPSCSAAARCLLTLAATAPCWCVSFGSRRRRIQALQGGPLQTRGGALRSLRACLT